MISPLDEPFITQYIYSLTLAHAGFPAAKKRQSYGQSRVRALSDEFTLGFTSGDRFPGDPREAKLGMC